VTVRPDEPRAVSSLEAEALDPRPADALPRATAAWDASACARQDAMVDAPHQEVRPPSADGAERLVAPVLAAQARDDSTPQWEPRAAPAVAPGAEELCTPAAARSAEQSSAAPVAAQQPDVLQLASLAERSRIPTEAFPQMEPVQQEAVP
jgi:hypothetical protein